MCHFLQQVLERLENLKSEWARMRSREFGLTPPYGQVPAASGSECLLWKSCSFGRFAPLDQGEIGDETASE